MAGEKFQTRIAYPLQVCAGYSPDQPGLLHGSDFRKNRRGMYVTQRYFLGKQ